MIYRASVSNKDRLNSIFKKSTGTRGTRLFGSIVEYIDNQMIMTLQKAPRKRTNAELGVLAKTVIDKDFFNDFRNKHGEAALIELLRSCYYELTYDY